VTRSARAGGWWCRLLLAIIVLARAPLAAGAAEPAKPEGAKPDATKPETAKPDATAKAEADKTAEEMARLRADLLARHQGADEARLTQLMGPPAERSTAERTSTLVWKGPTEAGADAPCRMAMMLASGGLANLELSGQPAWDRKLCRKFLRPLLQALPWSEVHKASEGTAAGALVLTNAEVLEMVKEGMAAQAILGKIRTQPCKFDVSTDALSSLRRSGASEPVLQAMIDRGCS
jgi:hypothetical protein